MNRLIALVGAVVAAAAVALLAGVHLGSAAAATSSGPFTVTVVGTGPYAFQDSNGSAPANLQVPLGATVSFSNPGTGFHDVDFDSAAPSACSGSSSINSTSASFGPWQGSCTFNTVGTYSFHCSIHFFTGEIVVSAEGGGGTGSSGATGNSGPTGGGGGAGGGSTGATGAAPVGAPAPPGSGGSGTTAVGGQPPPPKTVTTGPPKATIAALTVPAVARGFAVSASAKLGRGHSTLRASVRLGRSTLGALTRRRVGPGRVSFTVTLDAHGRKLLRARHSLAVVLVVTVTSPDGSRATRTRTLRLRV